MHQNLDRIYKLEIFENPKKCEYYEIVNLHINHTKNNLYEMSDGEAINISGRELYFKIYSYTFKKKFKKHDLKFILNAKFYFKKYKNTF